MKIPSPPNLYYDSKNKKTKLPPTEAGHSLLTTTVSGQRFFAFVQTLVVLGRPLNLGSNDYL